MGAYKPTVENKPGTIAAAFAGMPQGVILHGSRSGSQNDTAAEYRATAGYAASGIELGWNATIGDDIYAIHMPAARWGWNARAASQHYLAVEFAQATADRPISDAQVNAFCHWFNKEAREQWPAIALVFPTHAELPEGQADGKTDVFPKGDPRADDLRARILARLGFSLPPVLPTPSTGGKPWDGTTRFSMEADRAFSVNDLLPLVQQYAASYGSDPRIIAGMIQQESTFHNYRVHRDGTGHGLLGYDDNGLLADFEQWSGLQVGRGAAAAIIPVEPQLEFCAMQLRKFQDYYANDPAVPGTTREYVGARAWHAGGGPKYPAQGWDQRGRNSESGKAYERLIRGRIVEIGL